MVVLIDLAVVIDWAVVIDLTAVIDLVGSTNPLTFCIYIAASIPDRCFQGSDRIPPGR